MKKKETNPKLKKLTLNRETLRNLGEKETSQAVGGGTRYCTVVSCLGEATCLC